MSSVTARPDADVPFSGRRLHPAITISIGRSSGTDEPPSGPLVAQRTVASPSWQATRIVAVRAGPAISRSSDCGSGERPYTSPTVVGMRSRGLGSANDSGAVQVSTTVISASGAIWPTVNTWIPRSGSSCRTADFPSANASS